MGVPNLGIDWLTFVGSNDDHSTTADCNGVRRFSILGVGVGVPNLGIDWLTFIGEQ